MARIHILQCALPACGKDFPCGTGRLNRARAIEAPLYCSRRCAGIGRRSGKTLAQRREAKRDYDLAYRARQGAARLQKKRQYWATNKHRFTAHQAAYRHAHVAEHTAYCQQPRYKAYKKGYDQRYRSQKFYGLFWEAAMVLHALETEVRQRATKTERAVFKGTRNKALQRRRAR